MGFSREEVIGRSIRSFMTPESVTSSREVTWPTLMGQGELHDAEFRLVAEDGQIIDVLASAKGESDAAGRFMRALCGLVDVTARKQAEATEAADLVPRDFSERTDPQLALKPVTVLVMDDDALVLANTAELVEDLGHAALRVSPGEGALDLLRGGMRVDVVVTDHAMPGMTGTQLARAIKARWPGLPIILASGYAELFTDLDPALPRLAKLFPQVALAEAIAGALRMTEEAGRVVPFRARHV